ncbi:SGNH/GDSL hydrolase family protein [Cryomorphaceae bacterium 1068]|nr:SGNH/GDSL hydrolase family protein [Cryomorphaceae bacterium 1068]
MGLIFIILMSLASCNDKEGPTPPADTAPMQDTIRFSYLALGDSYTIGTALPDSSRNYPTQLVGRLNEDSLLEGSEPDIVAFGGWRTDQLISAIEIADLAGEYDLVSLLIGVNNQFQNQPLDVYGMEFEQLLQTAIQFAGNDTDRIFVLSIPDYGVTPFGQGYPDVSQEIDIYNDINRDITESYAVKYFNITEISRMAQDNPSLIAPDNLHPSGDMYELWVNEILEEVKAKLYE